MNAWAEYEGAWLEFTLAFQEAKDAVGLFLKEYTRVTYWLCSQNPNEHVFDYDDWRLIEGHNWRTAGKQLCPKCAGILEQRSARVYAQ